MLDLDLLPVQRYEKIPYFVNTGEVFGNSSGLFAIFVVGNILRLPFVFRFGLLSGMVDDDGAERDDGLR